MTTDFILKALAGALCFALAGCSGETTAPSSSLATPSPAATATVGQNGPDEPPAASDNGSQQGSQVASIDAGDSPVSGEIDKNEGKTDITTMSIEPGKERYFQNGLNDAELAYVRERNERKRKARIAAAEQRKQDLRRGNDAPVFDVGGGELQTVNTP